MLAVFAKQDIRQLYRFNQVLF